MLKRAQRAPAQDTARTQQNTTAAIERTITAPAYADTADMTAEPIAPPSRDTEMPSPQQAGPAPLPKRFAPTSTGGLRAHAAPGFVLNTARNTSEGREVARSRGCHLCRPGEGYVVDESICEVDPQTGLLLYMGDVVTVMDADAYEEKRQHIGALVPKRKVIDAETMSSMRVIGQRYGEKVDMQTLDPDEF